MEQHRGTFAVTCFIFGMQFPLSDLLPYTAMPWAVGLQGGPEG